MPDAISTSGRLISINTGKPKTIRIEGVNPFKSSFLRNPVDGKIFLSFQGLENDQIADPRVHGGPDKAVCVYPAEHYSYWEKETGKTLSPGAFGENFTIEGLTESHVRIGDVFQVGEAQVLCTQPRQPCHKINKVFQIQEMACRIKTTGFSGFYLKVLQQGWVEPGAGISLIREGEGSFTIDEVNSFLFRDKSDMGRLQQACQLDALSDDWKKLLKKRLKT